MYSIMAAVNAMRSRDDAEKIKSGLERKHAEGGHIGPAPLGYLNVRETLAGREVASIAPDPDRVDFIKLAFDLYATGDYTIASLVEVLDAAGLRSRETAMRTSKPLNRATLHRLLRDDTYIGIVTHKGVKQVGRHEPLIDRHTFERVQEILLSNAATGDRSSKHSHYLRGSLYCAWCDKRMGYGRHRAKSGVHYDYFSCLSRVTRGGRCEGPYFGVDAAEKAIERHYLTVTLSPDEQETIREAIRAYVEPKVMLSKREAARHTRKLQELMEQQQKLVQPSYKGLVSDEVLAAEQERIDRERSETRRWAEAATTEVADVFTALDEALALVDTAAPYSELQPTQRRLVNQAIFSKLFLHEDNEVDSEPAPLYAELYRLNKGLAASGRSSGGNKKNTDPVRRGAGVRT